MIIFDTAPTGHALRFLSLPQVLDSWVGKLIKLRLQLSGALGLVKKILPFGGEGETSGVEQLERMKAMIQEARGILSDPKRTHYAIVIIPELMSILESERSLRTLKEYRIPVRTIIINQVIPQNPGCGFCAEKRAQQLKRIAFAKKRFKSFRILAIPALSREVTGTEMLDQLGKKLADLQ